MEGKVYRNLQVVELIWGNPATVFFAQAVSEVPCSCKCHFCSLFFFNHSCIHHEAISGLGAQSCCNTYIIWRTNSVVKQDAYGFPDMCSWEHTFAMIFLERNRFALLTVENWNEGVIFYWTAGNRNGYLFVRIFHHCYKKEQEIFVCRMVWWVTIVCLCRDGWS